MSQNLPTVSRLNTIIKDIAATGKNPFRGRRVESLDPHLVKQMHAR